MSATRTALLKHFKDEAKLEAAIAAGDVQALQKADGVSEQAALRLVRKARSDETEAFVATSQARQLLESVLDLAADFAATPQGRDRIRLLAPKGTPEEATRHAAWVMEQKAKISSLDRDAVRRALRALKPCADAPPRFDTTRMVIAFDAAQQDRLVRMGIQRWAQVGGPNDLALAEDADLVLVVREGDAGTDLPNALDIGEDPAWAAVAPEAVVAWFEANRRSLEACAALARLAKSDSSADAALALLDQGPRRISAARLRTLLEEELKLTQTALQARIATLSITGQELMESFGKRLPASIQKAIDATLEEAKQRLRAAGVTAIPFTRTLPIALDEEELERLEAEGTHRAARHHYEAFVKVAKRLAPLRPVLEAEVTRWQEFDVAFGLGCFALACDLRPATWATDLRLEGAIHLALAQDPAAQRIHYHLGTTESVALLTGANSGGKTTLLETVGQVAILARLGLPVPAAAAGLPWFDEVHLLSARRTLDAGAFETFLRTFLPLAQPTARRLVLADEVEAVTEAEAAGRILAFFLERMARTESLAIVVTHMAPHILAGTQAPLRVDGIEATGLDDQNRLVVDRNPRLGQMARSTPEFIVQRLAATAKGKDKAMFEELAAAFAPRPRKLRGGPSSPAP